MNDVQATYLYEGVDGLQIHDGNVDVSVVLKDGTRCWATLFTYTNVATLTDDIGNPANVVVACTFGRFT